MHSSSFVHTSTAVPGIHSKPSSGFGLTRGGLLPLSAMHGQAVDLGMVSLQDLHTLGGRHFAEKEKASECGTLAV